MGKSTKILITMILILLLLTGGAYAIGAYYFANHFMPGSTLNGYNVSYMTAEEAEELIDREVKAYALAVETRGNGREAITANQVGLTYRSRGSIAYMIHGQKLLDWFMHFNEEHNYDLSRSISFDEAKMEAAIKDLDCMQPENMISPQDAAIVESGDGYAIREEVWGTTLDRKRVMRHVSQAMLYGKVRVNLEEEGCYVSPSVLSYDPLIVSNCEKLNRMTSGIITYDFGKDTETVDGDVVKEWLRRDEDGSVVLDRGQVKSYLQWLAISYNTIGNMRNFETYDGRTIQVGGGDYGWEIDVDGETSELYSLIESGATLVREPLYSRSAARRSGMNDIGFTYVEVDINAQKLVYYQDGIPLIETDCVTGSPANGEATPTGVFRAGVKESPKVLTKGFGTMALAQSAFTSDEGAFTSEENTGLEFADDAGLGAAEPALPALPAPQEPLPETANAYFWMPFADFGITEGIARGEYGGNQYLLNGTGGDVEIIYDAALQLYDVFEPNLPVVIY